MKRHWFCGADVRAVDDVGDVVDNGDVGESGEPGRVDDGEEDSSSSGRGELEGPGEGANGPDL